MTDPSQYIKGRTVQEQMNEVIGYVDVRSAEVATTAIASDVAQVHQDMLDADADAQAAAASAAAAAGTLANAVKKTGEASQSIAGDIAVAGNLSGGTVTVPTPVNNTDAASKKYVDDQDALDAKLAGATFTGQLNATGQRAYDPSNVNDVATIGTLDAYTPMIRTSGNQTKRGILTFKSDAVINIYLQSDSATINTDSGLFPRIGWYDKDGIEIAKLLVVVRANGTTALAATTRNSDGTQTTTILSEGSVI